MAHLISSLVAVRTRKTCLKDLKVFHLTAQAQSEQQEWNLQFHLNFDSSGVWRQKEQNQVLTCSFIQPDTWKGKKRCNFFSTVWDSSEISLVKQQVNVQVEWVKNALSAIERASTLLCGNQAACKLESCLLPFTASVQCTGIPLYQKMCGFHWISAPFGRIGGGGLQ